ncbi:MAG: potassium-transporting ATPase subunit C [Asticcacaulis sp.]
MDRTTYALGVAMALLLLVAGAWPHAQPSRRQLDGQAGYFWRTDEAGRITPDDAARQARRVAAQRRLSRSRLDRLIALSTHNDIYNIAGRTEVDIAELNDRLDGRLP